jgi:predicted nuclease of predicted toxin-antitoxin system
MRFLLDENLSPKVAAPLRAAGHDVAIAREVGLRTATDQVVIETARREARVLISADTDIGAILALSGAATPSFVLVRRAANRRPDEQAALILNNLETVVTDLAAGHRRPRRNNASHPSPAHRRRQLTPEPCPPSRHRLPEPHASCLGTPRLSRRGRTALH